MSTIKSSAENLTLNADGANNDIKFQSNGSEVASIDQAGTITATTFTGAGSTPSIVDGGNATAMTINSSEQVGIGTTPISTLSLGQTGGGNGNQLFFTYNGGSTDRSYSIGTNAYAWGELDIQASDANDTTIDRRILNVSRDGDVRIDTGDLIFGTANKGIVLGATTNVAANTLDDYEEGTWTPTLTLSGSLGYATREGTYTKVGNLVNATFAIVINSVSSLSSVCGIGSLPFTVRGDSTADSSPIQFGIVRSLTTSYPSLTGYLAAGGTTSTISVHLTNGGHVGLPGNAITASTILYGSMVYNT